MTRQLPLVIALLVLVGAGLYNTGTGSQIQCADGDLYRIQFQIPGESREWSLRSLDLSPGAQKKAGIQQSVMRRYIHRDTNQEVSLLLVNGRGGPMSVHTPEVCFESSGYTLAGEKVRYTYRDDALNQADFWLAEFQKKHSFGTDRLRIYWSWHVEGKWQAPENPRLAFARQMVVHKLYLIHRIRPTERDASHDPCLAFMKTFIDQSLQ